MVLLITCGVVLPASALARDDPMGFLVTSVGTGEGGDLGGLEGAYAHCQDLAEAAGAGDRRWRAYLGTEEPDRRGVIARNLTDLHLYNRTITLETALDEKGERVKGRSDEPNEHDILTGTQDDGTAYFPDEADHTCNNWTSGDEGSAQVGHHDRHGGGNPSWASAHASRGCSMDALRSSGGAGLFYCFAAD